MRMNRLIGAILFLAVCGVFTVGQLLAESGSGIYDETHTPGYAFYATTTGDVLNRDNTDTVLAYPSYTVPGDTSGNAVGFYFSDADSFGYWYPINPPWGVYSVYRDSAGTRTLLYANMLIVGTELPDSIITDTLAFYGAVVPGWAIVDDAITSGKIDSAAVTTDLIAAGAVDSQHVANAAVYPGHLETSETFIMAALQVDSIAANDSSSIAVTDDIASSGDFTTSGDLVTTGFGDVTCGDDMTVAGDLEVTGTTKLSGAVGAYASANSARLLNAEDTSLNTTTSKIALYGGLTKTEGASDAADGLTGVYGYAANNDADQDVGAVQAGYFEGRNTTGNAQNVFGLNAYSYAVGDTIKVNQYGAFIKQNAASGSHVDGNTYGLFVDPTVYSAATVDGTSYSVYLDDGSWIDFAIYSAEDAPSELLGDLSVPQINTDDISPNDSSYIHLSKPFEYDTNFQIMYDVDDLAADGIDTVYMAGAEPGDLFAMNWACQRTITGGYFDNGVGKYVVISPNIYCYKADSLIIGCDFLRSDGCDTLWIRDIGPAAAAD